MYASQDEADKPVDKAALAGLDPAHVSIFTGMGFDSDQVIETLAKLNYRGSNAANVAEDQGWRFYLQ